MQITSRFPRTFAALTTCVILMPVCAHADDYTDLLDVLRSRGSLSASEYSMLKHKHSHGGNAVLRRTEQSKTVPRLEPAQAAIDARTSVVAAAARAAAADADLRKIEDLQKQIETNPDLVHVEPYKPGAGVNLRVGDVNLNFSGIVDGFYTFSSADTSRSTVAAGLTDASGFDSSSVRNGLLPGAFIFTASTEQEGIHVSATIGVYPGVNTTSEGALGANTAGNATALGTANGDFRKVYLTFGTKDLGTIKLGRDIGIFGSDAILNDQTLLGVGATGGNADPGNTSLGRIGLGYIYADFLPQITYSSPILHGLQATIGVFQPLNAFNFAGSHPNIIDGVNEGAIDYSSTTSTHSSPEFEGKITYDAKTTAFSAHLWAGFITQSLQNIATANGTTVSGSKQGVGGEGGAVLTFGPAALTGYIYRGTGIGTTAKFFDAIGPSGNLRGSDGGYIQGSYKIVPKLKLIASYGVSNLYQAPGENDPDLVRRNESETAGLYYGLTDWVTLVGEFTHSDSKSHGPQSTSANSVSAGAILFY